MKELLDVVVENWGLVSGIAVSALPRYISRPLTEVPQIVWESMKSHYKKSKGGKP